MKAKIEDLFNNPNPLPVPPPIPQRNVFPSVGLDGLRYEAQIPLPPPRIVKPSIDAEMNLTPPSALRNSASGMTKSQSWTGKLQLPPSTSTPLKVNPTIKESRSDYDLKHKDSLIDLGGHDLEAKESKLTKVSVLEAFDPLSMSRELEALFDKAADEVKANDEVEGQGHDVESQGNDFENPYGGSDTSFYETYDPFEYMSTLAERQDEDVEDDASERGSTSGLQRVIKHTRQPSVAAKAKGKVNAKVNDSAPRLVRELTKEKDVAVDGEIVAFTKLVTDVRAKAKATPGYVVSTKGIRGPYPEGTSVKLVVQRHSKVTSFTCDGKFIYYALGPDRLMEMVVHLRS